MFGESTIQMTRLEGLFAVDLLRIVSGKENEVLRVIGEIVGDSPFYYQFTIARVDF